MDRVQRAVEGKSKGYNCAQSVACAFSDVTGVDEEILFKATEGYGGGMGDMQCTCGAVTGAVMVCGLLNSRGRTVSGSKAETMKLARQITQRFRKQNGSVICKELKGVETGKMLRSCPDCVADAVKLVEEIVMNKS